jgi:hypothetical protein
MTEEKTNRGRDEEAQDPDREGGLGSRRDEAPGQNKPEPEGDETTTEINVTDGGTAEG